MTKKYTIAISIMAVSISVIILMFINRTPSVLLNQKGCVFEGTLDATPIRMLLCRDGSNLKAYYVTIDDNKEYTLTGTYNYFTKQFKLENNDASLLLRRSTLIDKENNGLIILKGTAFVKDVQSDNKLYLIPVWNFNGSERYNLYSDLGYDTKQVEIFTDTVTELIHANNSLDLSSLVSYPLSVYINNEQLTISDEQEFQSNFDNIFAEKLTNCVRNNFSRYLFGDYRGLQFGNHNSFWFYPNPDNRTFKITSISITDENYNYDKPSDEIQSIEKG